MSDLQTDNGFGISVENTCGNSCHNKRKQKNCFLLKGQTLGSVARPRNGAQRGNLYGRVQLVKVNLWVLVTFLYDLPTQSLISNYGIFLCSRDYISK